MTCSTPAERADELRGQIEYHNRALPRARRPRDLRRRVRRARPRAAGPRGGSTPSCVTPDSPTQQVGGGAVAAVRPGRAPRADDVARQRLLLRRAGGLGQAHGALHRGRRRLRVRAEDRRRRHVAPLRGRPLRAGRHPGRRRVGEDVTENVAHHRRHPRAASTGDEPARRARGAGRGLHAASPPSRSSTSARPRPAAAPLRQPPQLRRRLAAPEGPDDHRQPRAARSGPTSSARSRAARVPAATPRRSTACEAAGLPVNPEIRTARLARRGLRLLPRTGSSTATTSTTRSTAWW